MRCYRVKDAVHWLSRNERLGTLLLRPIPESRWEEVAIALYLENWGIGHSRGQMHHLSLVSYKQVKYMSWAWTLGTNVM